MIKFFIFFAKNRRVQAAPDRWKGKQEDAIPVPLNSAS